MKKWLDKYADGGDVPQPKILQDFNKYAESPEGKDYFKMLHDNQRAQQMSGRVEYSDIDPITDIALPFAGIAGTVGKGLVKKGAKDIGELISKKRFKSEINWGNWNKEIPENSQLMKEYHIIEQAAKDNGSWMKYDKKVLDEEKTLNNKKLFDEQEKEFNLKNTQEEEVRRSLYEAEKAKIDIEETNKLLDSNFQDYFDNASAQWKRNFENYPESKLEFLDVKGVNRKEIDNALEPSSLNIKNREADLLTKYESVPINKFDRTNESVYTTSIEDFPGTPEQFVQSNSENFKKAYPEGWETVWRGGDRNPELNTKYIKDGEVIFTTKDEYGANVYNKSQDPYVKLKEGETPEQGLTKLYAPATENKIVIDGEHAYTYDGRKILGQRRNYARLNALDQTPSTLLQQENLNSFKNWMRKNHPETDLSDRTMTDHFASFLNSPEGRNIDRVEFKKIYDGTIEPIDVEVHNLNNRKQLKSVWGNNGMFDMTNPNIYKALIPGALGVGALQQKKNGGTMQEYQENYNDSQTSLPPGFVGMGNDISGRNYSPAWGGQFAMGGSIPGSVGFTYARTINPAPSEGPYAKKTMPSAEDGKKINNNLDIQEQRYKQLYPPLIDKIVNAAGNDYESLPLGNKTFIESKFDGLNNPEGRNLPPMDPIIKEVQNKLLTLPESELNELLKVNWKHISAPEAFFKKPKNIGMGDMLKYINHFKKLKSQGYTLQNGGEMPSAQNGQEMKYWQEGLDWKPKSISKNGGWLNKYAEGGELPPEVIVEAPPEFVPLEDIPGEPGEPKNSPKKQSDFIYDQNERRSRHSFLESSFNPRAESSKINAKGEKEIIAVGPFGIRDIAIKDYNRLTGENLTRNDAYDFKTAGKIRNVLLDSYDNYDILQDPKLSRENKIRIKYGMYNAGPGTFAKEYNAIKEKYGVYNNPTWYKHLNRETGDYVTRATTRGDSKWEEEYKKGLKQHPDVVRKLRHKDGGNITKDDNGYWNPDNWGKPVEIGSNDITMQGVNQPLLGISDTGDTQYMVPGKDYKFKGKKVREYPVAQNGLRQEQKSLQNLDNLTNFTNYNTPQKGGWLQKYSK